MLPTGTVSGNKRKVGIVLSYMLFFFEGEEKFTFFLGEKISYLIYVLFDTWVVAIVESGLNCTGIQLSSTYWSFMQVDFHVTKREVCN